MIGRGDLFLQEYMRYPSPSTSGYFNLGDSFATHCLKLVEYKFKDLFFNMYSNYNLQVCMAWYEFVFVWGSRQHLLPPPSLCLPLSVTRTVFLPLHFCQDLQTYVTSSKVHCFEQIVLFLFIAKCICDSSPVQHTVQPQILSPTRLNYMMAGILWQCLCADSQFECGWSSFQIAFWKPSNTGKPWIMDNTMPCYHFSNILAKTVRTESPSS